MTWRVLKWLDLDEYAVVGEIDSQYEYVHPSAQAVGEKFGVGEFLLFRTDADRYVAMTVAASPATYYEATTEEVAA